LRLWRRQRLQLFAGIVEFVQGFAALTRCFISAALSASFMRAAVPGLELAPAARFSGFPYGCWLVDSLLKFSMADSPFYNSDLVAK
jgi:hypothetical protein